MRPGSTPWPQCAADAPSTPSEWATAFSTALPYDLGSDRVVLLLVPAPTGDWRSPDGDGHRADSDALAELRAAAANGLGFELRIARSFGPSKVLATVTVGPPLPDDQTEELRFNPWTTGPGMANAPSSVTCMTISPCCGLARISVVIG